MMLLAIACSWCCSIFNAADVMLLMACCTDLECHQLPSACPSACTCTWAPHACAQMYVWDAIVLFPLSHLFSCPPCWAPQPPVRIGMRRLTCIIVAWLLPGCLINSSTFALPCMSNCSYIYMWAAWAYMYVMLLPMHLR